MKIYSVISVLLCTCLLSCKKDKTDPNNVLASTAKNLSIYDMIPYDSYTVLSPVGTVKDSINNGFAALLASKFGSDVVLTASIDTSMALIKAYNSLYHVNYPALPRGLFKVKGGGQHIIKAGQTRSVDSIRVQIANFANLPTSSQEYAVPVVLQSTTAGAVLASKLMFVRFKLAIIYNDIDQTNRGLIGTTIDRSTWSVTSNNPGGDYAPASNMWDGDNNTFWLTSVSNLPESFVLDMGTSNTVKGFTYVAPFGGYYDVTGMTLKYSNDGVVWKPVGDWVRAQSGDPIKFINPLTARYFKFIVTKASNRYYVGIAELNGIN
ncbi:discoidin domain-containing protein [Pedobacter nutrimenti]|uniref:discoidin domain-containing protein n=1 Tax=Pedobacter nutrimenti TaxID=1241337 RepID=UPI00293146BB|nr:discoidin domain-containing protein [Pedobacter nutrimenti]